MAAHCVEKASSAGGGVGLSTPLGNISRPKWRQADEPARATWKSKAPAWRQGAS
jgi:hypothetical protein